MHAKKVSLFELLEGSKQFQIPTYQRAFSWGERQVHQLWADVRTEATRVRSGQPAGHFLGSLVLAQADDIGPAGVSKWLVVDGQQRLSTLMILLSAVRDGVASHDADLADKINRDLLVNTAYSDDRRLKLLPTQHDRASFSALMLQHQPLPTAGKVADAYDYFRARVRELIDEPALDEFPAIFEAIHSKLDLVQIVAGPGDNAHRIFQTLNSTGLKLTQTDLVRNHLFMRLPQSIDQVYHDIWMPMQGLVGDEGIETVLWLDLILRGQDSAPKSEVFRLQVERFGKLRDEAEIAVEIQKIAQRARYLHLMMEPGGEKNPDLRERLMRLKEWNAVTTLPVTMMALELRAQQRITAEEAARALLLVESFCVRRVIAGIPTNSLGRIFSAAPKELAQSRSFVEDLHRYLSAPKRHWPDDVRLSEAIQTRPFYLSSRGQQRAYILRRLEDCYPSKEKADWKAEPPYTVEHVLPQSLTDEWRDSLAGEAERFGITVHQLHKLVVHTLGNLTLTAYNTPLSNHSFPKKREVFKKSALAMNREIAESQRWNGLSISKRGLTLMEKAAAIWPAPIVTNGLGVARDWDQLHRALLLVPSGKWTSFGDLAEATGSHPVSVGSHLASRPAPNSWRVLLSDGMPSPQLATAAPAGGQRSRLESEGVSFGPRGNASPSQKMTAEEIIRLMSEASPRT